MLSLKTILLFSLVGLLNLSAVAPDSAGIVEMVNGLAYGGIPYGSVTGMVAKYSRFMGQQINTLQSRQFNEFGAVRPLVVAPNFRDNRLVGAQRPAVQVYNFPGVIAPGVLATIGRIRY